MYYLISNHLKQDLLDALARRKTQKARQDEEYVKEMRASGFIVACMMEVPNVDMLGSIIQSAPRLSLNHFGLPAQPDAEGGYSMIGADTVKAILHNLEALYKEEATDDLCLLSVAISTSPQLDLPTNYSFIDAAGHQWEITAWSEEEAKRKIEASGGVKAPVEPTGTCSSWFFDAPIWKGYQGGDIEEETEEISPIEPEPVLAVASAEEVPF